MKIVENSIGAHEHHITFLHLRSDPNVKVPQFGAAQGFTKNGVFLSMVMSIFFLFKRLINVEMVSELLVVHLSQNEAYLLHDSDSSQQKSYD